MYRALYIKYYTKIEEKNKERADYQVINFRFAFINVKTFVVYLINIYKLNKIEIISTNKRWNMFPMLPIKSVLYLYTFLHYVYISFFKLSLHLN